MTQADSVHSTPPTNTSPLAPVLHDAVDAFSASPAIRRRFQHLAAKARLTATPTPAMPFMPPPVEIPSQPLHPFYDGTQRAYDNRHPLAHLMKLRDEAAAEVERLLTFLDETDAIVDMGDDEEPLEIGGDEEPSLGSIESYPDSYTTQAELLGLQNQERWAAGNTDDCEGDEHDGREPDDNEGGEAVREDDEPSLGWTVDGLIGTTPADQVDCEMTPHSGVSARKRRQQAKPADLAIANFNDPNAGKVFVNRLRRGFPIDGGRRT